MNGETSFDWTHCGSGLSSRLKLEAGGILFLLRKVRQAAMVDLVLEDDAEHELPVEAFEEEEAEEEAENEDEAKKGKRGRPKGKAKAKAQPKAKGKAKARPKSTTGNRRGKKGGDEDNASTRASFSTAST